MPDTPIDQSNSIQSIRLKVPTGTVPVPPVGFGQLHSPSPGVLALRLPDGSVVEIGPAAGGGGDGDTLVLADQETVPDPPSPGTAAYWLDTSGRLHRIDDEGNENFEAAGGTETGSGALLQLSALFALLQSGSGRVRVGNATVLLDAQTDVGDPGQLLIYGLPTSDPGVFGAVWADAGTLKISGVV